MANITLLEGLHGARRHSRPVLRTLQGRSRVHFFGSVFSDRFREEFIRWAMTQAGGATGGLNTRAEAERHFERFKVLDPDGYAVIESRFGQALAAGHSDAGAFRVAYDVSQTIPAPASTTPAPEPPPPSSTGEPDFTKRLREQFVQYATSVPGALYNRDSAERGFDAFKAFDPNRYLRIEQRFASEISSGASDAVAFRSAFPASELSFIMASVSPTPPSSTPTPTPAEASKAGRDTLYSEIAYMIQVLLLTPNEIWAEAKAKGNQQILQDGIDNDPRIASLMRTGADGSADGSADGPQEASAKSNLLIPLLALGAAYLVLKG